MAFHDEFGNCWGILYECLNREKLRLGRGLHLARERFHGIFVYLGNKIDKCMRKREFIYFSG